MAKHLVTIGMPVHNGARFLGAAIDSILAQDHADFELIISDNASEDETEAICRRYARLDARIRYDRLETNLGAAANYNRVFELRRGDYFKWAAHDDVCLPGFLGECVRVLDAATPDTVLVYPRSSFVDEEGRLIEEDRDCLDIRDARPFRRMARAIARVNMMNAIFGVFRSDALARTRLIDRFEASDYVLMAEIALLGKIVEVPRVLFHRRYHARMSMLANPSHQQRRQWFDSGSKRSGLGSLLGTWFPKTVVDAKLVHEWRRSARRFPLGARERWLCYLAAPTVWYWRRFRCWGGRQKARVKQILGGRGRA